ncbi:EAL domain-containing protein [Litoribacillus peritrichatus]|uniref:EAL domain-containing protein n=1 Tax=Litoribacillus peritrichatus TaxID=718191 RepID=A0ABP7N226_9GAMM
MILRCFFQCLAILSLFITPLLYAKSGELTNVFTHENQRIDAEFDYFEDGSSALNLQQVLELSDSDWTHVESNGAHFGFSESSYWFRIQFANHLDEIATSLVELAKPTLDVVEFYSVQEDQVVNQLITGSKAAFDSRDVDHPNFVFRVLQERDQTSTVYVRVKTQGSSVFAINLWQEKRFFEVTSKAMKFHFLYFGGLLVVILLNLSIYMMLRERIYLYYSLALVGYLMFFSGLRGFSFQHLFFDWPELNQRVFLASMPCLAIFSVLFTRDFLKTRTYAPRLDLALKVLLGLEYLKLCAVLVLDYNQAIRLSAALTLPLFLLLFISGPVIWKKGNNAGVFFSAAWFMLTVGMLLTFFRAVGVLPNSVITQFGMQIGSALESLILMIALAYRIYHEREAKILAQQLSIEQTRQKRESQERLVDLMLHDPVTKLPNRMLFEMTINEHIVQYPDSESIVLLVRIGRFTEVSRTLGLANGENLLQQLGERLNKDASLFEGVVKVEESASSVNYICNFSTDTFGVLLNRHFVEADKDKYLAFIEALRKPYEFMGFNVDLHPKCGAAIYPQDGDDASVLLRNASVSLDLSHSAASNINLYSKQHDVYNEQRLTLMSELRVALEVDKPELYYQPKLSARGDGVVGLEALIRWEHTALGFIPPDQFIPLAEETGLISDLTRWVFKRALKDFVRFKAEGFSGSLSVNISAKNLTEMDLPVYLSNLISSYQLDASQIILELTETAIMEDPEQGIIALKALTEVGVKLSIDDFGAGYSSLSYLKRLPATEIKLDRSLITGIAHSDSARIIVQTSIEMAHNLGYNLVAEGVETQEELDILCAMNCDNIQGYLLSRPLNVNDMCTWLLASAEETLT